MGSHTIGSFSNQAITAFKKCHEAGTPFSGVTIVISAQAAQLSKELSPYTITVVRPRHPDDYPFVNGRVKFTREWYDSYLDPIRPWLKYINFVKFLNEKWPGNDCEGQDLEDVRDFYWDLGRACYADGIGYTVLDLAAGNMNDWRWPGKPNQFAVMEPMLRWIATHGGILNYHCYNGLVPQGVYDPNYEPEVWVLRPVAWLERIPELRCICCEALVPEWKDASGQEAVLPAHTPDVISMIAKVDALWTGAIRSGRIREEQFLGFHPFTDQPGQRWEKYNMNPHMEAVGEYLRK